MSMPVAKTRGRRRAPPAARWRGRDQLQFARSGGPAGRSRRPRRPRGRGPKGHVGQDPHAPDEAATTVDDPDGRGAHGRRAAGRDTPPRSPSSTGPSVGRTSRRRGAAPPGGRWRAVRFGVAAAVGSRWGECPDGHPPWRWGSSLRPGPQPRPDPGDVPDCQGPRSGARRPHDRDRGTSRRSHAARGPPPVGQGPSGAPPEAPGRPAVRRLRWVGVRYRSPLRRGTTGWWAASARASPTVRGRPTIVLVAFVVGACLWGVGVVVYLALWALLPAPADGDPGVEVAVVPSGGRPAPRGRPTCC